jgi:hypothetical protein
LFAAGGQDEAFDLLGRASELECCDEVLKHVAVDSCCIVFIVLGEVSGEEDVLGIDVFEFFCHFFGISLEVEVGVLDI